MDLRLLEIIACPCCQGRLKYQKAQQHLICTYDQLIFPIKDGIPVLLIEEALPFPSEQEETL